MNVPDIIILGFPVPAVTLILVAEAVLMLVLMVVDYYLTKGARMAGVPSKPGMLALLVEIFFSFAILSSLAELYGVGADNIMLILISLVVFGFFIAGYGIADLRKNIYYFLAAVGGSLVGPLVLIVLGVI